ncbi:hypothetical protein V492_02702 [Pseudogymnoascus sp. VKM F-4246]|nr:hypothetical protein V492_02702 [Pseudogymnoascus sp. VKM F-4246]
MGDGDTSEGSNGGGSGCGAAHSGTEAASGGAVSVAEFKQDTNSGDAWGLMQVMTWWSLRTKGWGGAQE